MASNPFKSLAKLFSSDIVVRNIGGKRLKVIDPDRIQASGTYFQNDKFTRMYSSSGMYSSLNMRLASRQAMYGLDSTRQRLFRDYECLVGETIIPTPDGKKLTIKELSKKYPNKNTQFYVYSYDKNTNSIVLGNAHSVRKTKTEMTYKIILDNDAEIIATANHPFLMRNGNYKRVDELKEGDSLMPFYQKDFYGHRYRHVYNFNYGWVSEHRLIAEQFYRKLKKNEIVHHIDFNKTNNTPENLQIMNDKDHRRYHCIKINKEIIWSDENYEKQCKSISIAQLKRGFKWNGKRKGKNNPFYGKNHTKESNAKRSISLKKAYENIDLSGKNNPMFGRKRTDVEKRKIIESLGYTYISFDDILNKSYDMIKNNGKLVLKELAKNNDCSVNRVRKIIKQGGMGNWNEYKEYVYSTLNHKIKRIELYEVRDVYDMTVEKHHNFATEHCFVHNSMDTDAIISSALDIYSEECVGSDTIIPLLNGEKKKIKDLYDNNRKNFWVYSIDDEGKFIPANCQFVKYNGKKRMYKLTFEDGTTINASENHLWVVGGKLKYTSDIVIGDLVDAMRTKLSDHKSMPEYDSHNHRIINVEYIGEQDAYDLVNVGNNHIYAVEANDGSKLYCHNSTMKNETGNMLRIKAGNENVRDVLDNLFNDILNIEFNLPTWIRGLCKYGDYFLNLELADKYGVTGVIPLPVYEVQRVEGENAQKPHEIKFIIEGASYNGRREFHNFEVAHFRLLTDTNFLPYGKSMIEGARRVWKQLILMEDAMLIHRIMRAPERRIFKIDVGNLPPNEVDAFMQKIISQVKKVPYIDEDTGEYNLKFNLQNMTEDFYLPVRGGDSGTEIENLGGLEYNAIDDIEYLRNKMMAALKIPKAFLGYEEQVGSKCLHPDTKIPLLSGKILTIKQITELFMDNSDVDLWCYSFDFKTNSVVPGKIKIAEQTRKNAELIRVYLDNDTFVDATPDHNFLLKDGTKIQAKNLKYGDSLKTINRRNKKIAKNTNEYEQIYQPSDKKWINTHKLVDEYINGKIKKNGWVNERFDKNSLTVIHHVDLDRFNNSPNNLQRMRWDKHIELHNDLCNKNHEWLLQQKIRPILNKLPENRKRSSEIQKKRIKENHELKYKLCNAWLNKTFEERSEVCKKSWIDERKQITIDNNIKYNKAEKMLGGYKEKYKNGRYDMVGELNPRWRKRPSFNEIVEFINDNKKYIDISTIYKLAFAMNIHKTILQEVIEYNNYTCTEFMNYYWGFKKGRSNDIKRNDFIDISSHYNNINDFMKDNNLSYRGIRSILSNVDMNRNDWINNHLGSNFNHKVVKVEFLDERIDTYNMEVDDKNNNHNFLINNGLVIKNSTLAAEDVRFARTVEKIQKIIVSELYKIALIHLYLQGFTGNDLVDFELNLTNPSIIYEQEKIELWSSKMGLARDIKDLNMLSDDWVYRQIFDLSEHEIIEQKRKVIEDQKRKYRYRQIEDEGNDPAVTGQAMDMGESKDDYNLTYNESEENPYYTPVKPSEDGRRGQKQRTRKKDDPFGEDPIGQKDYQNILKLDKNLNYDANKKKHLARREDMEKKFKRAEKVLGKGKITKKNSNGILTEIEKMKSSDKKVDNNKENKD